MRPAVQSSVVLTFIIFATVATACESPFQCFVDPCSLPAPDGCIFDRCQANYCGGCNADYYYQGKQVCNECTVNECGPAIPMENALCEDGAVAGPTGRCVRITNPNRSGPKCEWEKVKCPLESCPPVCEIYCPYGNIQHPITGCPQCGCNENPSCVGVECPMVRCRISEYMVVEEGECCGKCKIDCRATLCMPPPERCPDGQVLVQRQNQCCPTCEEAQPDCSTVSCLPVDCPAGTAPKRRQGACCPQCES